MKRGRLSAKRSRSARERLERLQQGQCFRCGGQMVEPTIDHVIPLGAGGVNNVYLLALACLACNRDHGCRLPTREQLDRFRRLVFQPAVARFLRKRPTTRYGIVARRILHDALVRAEARLRQLPEWVPVLDG